ncbi:MAG: hypothetical protein IPI35_13435 [Deltaproteobacteria bacterium]|nr:hypothetical protein [Deltaproteobacteria bacterium]
MTDDPADELRTARLAELGLLAASLAHEVRQPLFAIKSLTQLADAQLARGGDAAHARSLLRSLLEQVDLLERVVDGVRLYSRAPGEGLSPVDCAACIEEVVALMRHRALARRVTLRVELATASPRASPTRRRSPRSSRTSPRTPWTPAPPTRSWCCAHSGLRRASPWRFTTRAAACPRPSPSASSTPSSPRRPPRRARGLAWRSPVASRAPGRAAWTSCPARSAPAFG